VNWYCSSARLAVPVHLFLSGYGLNLKFFCFFPIFFLISAGAYDTLNSAFTNNNCVRIDDYRTFSPIGEKGGRRSGHKLTSLITGYSCKPDALFKEL